MKKQKTKKPKPIIIHNEEELWAYLNFQIYASERNIRPVKFSKEMIEKTQFKIEDLEGG